MSNQDLDVDAIKRLVDDLSGKLGELPGDSSKLAELRAELSQLSDIVHGPEAQHSWIADRLKSVENVFEHAATELLADGVKASVYLAEIGRILGVR